VILVVGQLAVDSKLLIVRSGDDEGEERDEGVVSCVEKYGCPEVLVEASEEG
jgi:hypothetical protein